MFFSVENTGWKLLFIFLQMLQQVVCVYVCESGGWMRVVIVTVTSSQFHILLKFFCLISSVLLQTAHIWLHLFLAHLNIPIHKQAWMFSALCPLCLDASHWHVHFSSSSPWLLFFCLLWNFAGLRAPLSIMRMSHPLRPPSPPPQPHYSSLEPTSSSDISSYHAVKRSEALGPSGATRSPPSHFVFKLLCKVPPSGNAAPTAFPCCCPALCLSLSPSISSTGVPKYHLFPISLIDSTDVRCTSYQGFHTF